jgi:hypothetical protein
VTEALAGVPGAGLWTNAAGEHFRVKGRKRAEEKVFSLEVGEDGKPKYQKDPRTIGDWLGGTIVVDHPRDMAAVLEALERAGMPIHENEPFWHRANETGFRSHFFQLEVEPGFTAEFRVFIPEIAKVYDAGHHAYERWRDVELPAADRAAAGELSKRLYAGAQKSFEKRAGMAMDAFTPNALKVEAEVAKVRKAGLSWLDAAADDALARIKARGRGVATAGADPTVIADLGLVGARWIRDGLGSIADLGAKLTSEFGDWAGRVAKQVWDSAQGVLRKGQAPESAGARPTAQEPAGAPTRPTRPIPPGTVPRAASPAAASGAPRQSEGRAAGPREGGRGVPDWSDEDLQRMADEVAARQGPVGAGQPGGEPDVNLNPNHVSRDRRVSELNERLTGDEAFGREAGGARGPRRSWDEVRARAAKLKLDPDKVRKLFERKKGMLSDVELEAAAALRNELSENLLKVGARIDAANKAGRDIPEDLRGEYDALLGQLASVDYAIIGARAEAARALNIARKMGEKMSPLDRKLMRAADLQNVSDIQRIAVMDAIRRNDHAALAKLQREIFPATFFEKVMEVWRAGLLFGPPTHIVNFTSNAAKATALDPVEALLSGIGDGLRGVPPAQRERFIGESKAMLRGAKRALRGGAMTTFITRMMDAGTLQYESKHMKASDLSKFDNTVGKVSGKKGELARMSFHLLDASDKFWREIIEQQAVSRLGYREGKKLGLDGAALEAHVSEFEKTYGADRAARLTDSKAPTVRADHATIYKQVLDAMDRGTFQEEIADFPKHLQIATAKFPGLLFLFPFIKTPYNISKATVFRTPVVGFIASGIANRQRAAKGKQAEYTVSDRLAMQMVGTALVAAVWGAMQEEGGIEVTGNGPADPRELQSLIDSGWQPNSIKVGGTYIDYSRMEPFSTIMATAADLKDMSDLTKAGDRFDKALATFGSNFLDKTFLSGLDGAVAALQDPKRHLGQFVKQILGSLVPFSGLTRKIAQGIDPVRRVTDPYEFTDTLIPVPEATAASIPFLSESLPARRTPLGEERTRTGGTFQRVFNPFTLSEDKTGPLADVQREFHRIGYVPSDPQDFIKLRGGKLIDLSDKELAVVQDQYKAAAQQVSRLMRTPKYKNAADTQEDARPGQPTKQQLIVQIYNKARERGRDRLYMNPSFRARAGRIQRGLE